MSIPGASTPAHFKRAAGCLAATFISRVRLECGRSLGCEVFGSESFARTGSTNRFRRSARRGVGCCLCRPRRTAHRMNETFRSEDIVYVLLDADSDDPVFHYTRAFAQAQGSAVFSLSTSTPAEIGAYFASLDWTARVSSSASVRFASRAMTPHTNPEVQDISCIRPNADSR